MIETRRMKATATATPQSSFKRVLSWAGNALLPVLSLGVFGVLIVVALWMLSYLYSYLYLILNFTRGIVLAIDLVVLLPLACFRRSRNVASVGLVLSSYVFGAYLWLLSTLLVISLWGWGGYLLALLFTGGTVLPAALIATALDFYWGALIALIVVTVIALAAYFGGIALRTESATP